MTDELLNGRKVAALLFVAMCELLYSFLGSKKSVVVGDDSDTFIAKSKNLFWAFDDQI